MLSVIFILLKIFIFAGEEKKSYVNTSDEILTNYFAYRGYKIPEVYYKDGTKNTKAYIEYNAGKLNISNINLNNFSNKLIKCTSLLIEFIYKEDEQDKKVYFAYDKSLPNICDEEFRKIPGLHIEYDKGTTYVLTSNRQSIPDNYLVYDISILKIYKTNLEELKDFKLCYTTDTTFKIYDNKNNLINKAYLTYERAVLTVSDEKGPVPNAYIGFEFSTFLNPSIHHIHKPLKMCNTKQEMLIIKPVCVDGSIIKNAFLCYIPCNTLKQYYNTEYYSNPIKINNIIHRNLYSNIYKIRTPLDECNEEIIKEYRDAGHEIINKFMHCIVASIDESYVKDSKKIIYALNTIYTNMNKDKENVKNKRIKKRDVIVYTVQNPSDLKTNNVLASWKIISMIIGSSICSIIFILIYF